MCGQSLAGVNSRNCDPVCRSDVLFAAVLVNLPHAALGEILILSLPRRFEMLMPARKPIRQTFETACQTIETRKITSQ